MKLDIVGGKEIADRLHVPPNTVHQWSKRRLLPEPEATVSGQPAWSWRTIEEWARATGRLPGIRDGILDELARQPRETSYLAGALVARGLARSVSHVWQTLNGLWGDGLVKKATPNSWTLTVAGAAAVRGQEVRSPSECTDRVAHGRSDLAIGAAGRLPQMVAESQP